MTIKAKVDAIDRFVRTLKSGGLYDDINAACIMAGWTNLAGALYPLKGSAPTNNGFLDSDLKGIGLQGDASSYLNSNRANNADGQNDQHMAVFVCSPTEAGGLGSERYIGVYETALSPSVQTALQQSASGTYGGFSRNNSQFIQGTARGAGIAGITRNDPASFSLRIAEVSQSASVTAYAPSALPVFVFAGNLNGSSWRPTNATLSWYSIGSSTDLSALDAAVSTLMSDLRAIDEQGFEPETVNYLRAVEAADGSFLESGVKQAINRFIVGCKKDGIWDAIKASCILCGARTIAGALVPLAGPAPTAVNFVSGNYNRQSGLVGVPASNTYLNTNRAHDADPQDDNHIAVYATSGATSNTYFIGSRGSSSPNTYTISGYTQYNRSVTAAGVGAPSSPGLYATSRNESGVFSWAARGLFATQAGVESYSPTGTRNVYVFGYSETAGQLTSPTDARIAFYSVGSAISDLSLLDARVSNLVTEIAAAIP